MVDRGKLKVGEKYSYFFIGDQILANFAVYSLIFFTITAI